MAIMNKKPSLPRGRPVDLSLPGRILEAARQEFLRNGLEGGSISRIAQIADCSRVTVYEHFATKEALFLAALTTPALTYFKALTASIETLDTRQALLTLARSFSAAVLAPRLTDQLHLLYQGSAAYPEVAQRFFDEGPAFVEGEIARTLGRLVAYGELEITDTAVAAEQFMALIRGNEQIVSLLSLPSRRSDSERETYLETCVDFFLRGYRKLESAQ